MAFSKHALSKSEEKVPLDLKQCLKVAAAKELPHPWLGPSVLPYIALVLWSTLAALGMVAVGKLVLARVGDSSAFIGLLCATAFGFSVVDWMESKVNFSLALGATSPRKRAFLDSIYWTRALGVVLCVFGGIGALIYFCRHGWNSEGLSAGLINIRKLIEQWWLLPVSGGLGALVATALDNKLPKGRYRSAIGGLICGAAVAFGAVFLIVLLSCFARVLLGPVLTVQTVKTILPPEKATLAGLLLLLELGAIYLLKAFSWCSEPMSKANLGSIVRLQLCSTPAKVRACLDGWCQSLTGLQRNKEAEHPSPECAMCNIVGEELWRDVIGLIPVYIVVLGMGLWFASSLEDWKWLSNLLNFKLGSISLWLLLPLAAAAADVIEDACHFQYLKLHARDRSPGHLLTIFSCTMSWVKGICFVAAIILTLAGILQAAWLCAIQPEKFGWRGIPAVLVFLFGAAMLVALLVVPRFYQLVNKHAFGKTTNGRS